MAIGTPTTLGTLASGTPGASSYSLTTTAAIVANDFVVVGFSYDGNTTLTVSSVTDTAGNAYSRGVASDSGTTVAEIWYAQKCAAMSLGNSITVNLSASAGGASPTICIFAARITGVAFGGALDQSAHQEATTATPSVTTSALALASEIVFGIAHNQNTGPTYTESSGFTTLSNSTVNGQTRFSYQIVSSASAVTYAPTWSISAVCRTGVATFRAQQLLTMTTAAGNYSLTGAAAVLGKLYRLTAAAGAYALTGFAAKFPRATRLTATAGSYALTGAAVTLGRGLRMVTATGTYALTGVAVVTKFARRMATAAGSYTLTGVSLVTATFASSGNLIRKAKYLLQKIRSTSPTLGQ